MVQWSKYISRKFLVAVFDALFIILNEGLEWGIPPETYAYITAIVGAYILGEAWIDKSRAQ